VPSLPDSSALTPSSQGSKSGQPARSKSVSDGQPDPDLTVGSLVEVMSKQPLYGLIKWIGYLPEQKEPKKLTAGLEMVGLTVYPRLNAPRGVTFCKKSAKRLFILFCQFMLGKK